MPKKSYQRQVSEVAERAAAAGVDALFDRVTDFFSQAAENQSRQSMAAVPVELRRSAYKCSGCHNMFPFEGMAMISTKNDGFGTCDRCFRFMWHAGNEKMLALKQGVSGFANAAARGVGARPRPAAAPPAGPSPWEVLGVSQDATLEEIKKAYLKAAAQAHPDRVPPDAGPEAREAARARFEELTRNYNVLRKIKSPASTG